MLKRLAKRASIIIVVLIVAVLAYAATRPDRLHVQRSTLINASPDSIFPLIIDFHRWGAWSPYEQLDPTMKRTYSGSASGTGAVYEWSGNSNVGAGRMEITNAVPSSSVTIKLDFTSPLEGHDIAEFTLKPEASATNVTWAMDGPTPYVGKLMGVIFNMDSMIGDAFATGLLNLKAQAEK